jgi:hypothetical protein
MKSVVVYTAVFGGYDKIRAPTVVSPDADYILYTDRDYDVPPWQVKDISDSAMVHDRRTRRVMARRLKILPDWLGSGAVEYSVWHGGNVQLTCDPADLISLLGGKDIAAIVHSQRDCIYDEAKACIDFRMDDETVVHDQMNRYRVGGYPAHRGLHAAFVLVRRNTAEIVELCNAWWWEVVHCSIRDQLSFDYCCWKLGVEVATIPGNIYEGPFYKRYPIHGQ